MLGLFMFLSSYTSLNALVSATFLSNLSRGSNNSTDISRLQQFLTEQGFYSGPITGNFRKTTKEAVAAFQSLYGISPASGYFGAQTRDMANQIILNSLSNTDNISIESEKVSVLQENIDTAYTRISKIQNSVKKWQNKNISQDVSSVETTSTENTVPASQETITLAPATTTENIVKEATSTQPTEPPVVISEATTTETPTNPPTVITPVETPPVVTAEKTSIQITPETSTLEWGAYVGDGDSSLSDFENLVGKKMNLYADFEGWDTPFPSYLASKVGATGKTLIIFWEPSFGYDQINNGTYDNYIKEFANGAKNYNYPVILAPFDEMNLNEEAWGYGKNGNNATKFIAAWKRIHDIFISQGASNVKFGIAFNNESVPNVSGNKYNDYYPGTDYVDYVGLDGFNFGSPWVSFAQVFDGSMKEASSFGKPLYIFSTASIPGTNKALWISDGLGTHIKTYPNLKGWVWFNQNGGDGNWLINSDPASLSSFKSIIP
jgi:peptidoglycan hydrolase-like protein with peptidoglycan-binding domain